ncbi:hypothetical protein P3T37_004209 [Kitasatospora sp. MAA4]|uniref:hypothetical protein n=1 Tax=Kitasatospora sp. MAA4 TaxID=3035093 RepID=UPI002476F165|nr:hypothetical protein [Kitasatospora sp. MAA4]MDH6134800.1 hypothetical protein [Kitasatospora sp. MAA4]
MDDKTAAEPLAHPAVSGAAAAGPRGRRRRALAAGALLLAVAATVSGCNSGKTTAAAGSSSPAASASAAPSAGSAAPSPSTPAGTATAPGSAPGGSTAPTGPAPTRPAKPITPTVPPVGGGSAPDLPSHLKPNNYLSSGTQLTVFFFGGVCDKYGLKADESKAGQVGVSIVITEKAPAGQACPALVKQQGVQATLAHPLDGRAVVDLDTGANVPLESVPNGGPVSAGN